MLTRSARFGGAWNLVGHLFSALLRGRQKRLRRYRRRNRLGAAGSFGADVTWLGPAAEVLEDRTLLATLYWQGDVDTNWSTAGNWNTLQDGTGLDQAPANNDTLVFDNSTTGLANFTSNADISLTGITIQIVDADVTNDFTIQSNAGVTIGLAAAGITNNQTSGTATTISIETLSLAGATSITNTAGTLNVTSAITNGGNLLTVDGAGTTTLSGVTSGVGGLTKNGTGSLTLSGNNTYTGDTTLNAGTLQITGGIAGALAITANGNIQLTNNGGNAQVTDGTSTAIFAPGDPTAVTINGGAGDDTLTVNDPTVLPTGGLTFNGGANGVGGDSMVLATATVTAVTHTFTNANDGSVDIDGTVINYTGLEPITDNLSATNRTFAFTGAGETITLGDDAGSGNGISQIDSTLGESVTFANPTGTLTINASAGTGADTLNLQALDSNFNANVVVNLSNSGDTVNLTGVTGSTNSYTLNGGSGNDTFNLTASAITRPVGIGGGAGTDTIAVTGDATNETWTANAQTGTISGLSGGQNVTYGQVEALTFDLGAGTDDLFVVGTTNDDVYVYTPDVTANTSTLTGFNTTSQSVSTLSFTGVENASFHLDGNGGTDTLQVVAPGTEAVTADLDTIQVGTRV
ncbi:MAG: hypothetical protein GXP27_10460, partial [Planctomycetes bacterium]|nr:hypothetical protein [Planctomycetota bacterium]